MKAKIYYVSPKGSVEKVAESIAHAIRIVKEPLMPAYMPEGTTLMFLGCEGKKPDKTTMEFINSLDSTRTAYAALFCTNPGKSEEAIQAMRSALTARGVKVLDRSFVCQGKGFMGKHPTDADLQAAEQFAAACVKEIFD